MVALKEASGTLEMIQELKPISSIPILAGDDSLAYALMELGAVGVISIVANLIPEEWRTLTHAFLRGDRLQAKEIALLYEELNRSLVIETNPQGVKFALSQLDRCHPRLATHPLKKRFGKFRFRYN